MKITIRLTVISCLVLFAACKKDRNESAALSPRGQMLVAGKWQRSAGTAIFNYMGKDTTVDLYSLVEDCDKDDFVLFSADGIVTRDENTNKCPDHHQTEKGNWRLLENDTKIWLGDFNPDAYDLELTSTQMTLKITRSQSSGPVHYVEIYKNIK